MNDNQDSEQSNQIDEQIEHKKFKKGVFLVAFPFALLILNLIFYSVVSFLAGRAIISLTVGQIINVVLGLIGVIAVIWIVIGVPIGIIIMVKKPKQKK
jgi:hypothetical protein